MAYPYPSIFQHTLNQITNQPHPVRGTVGFSRDAVAEFARFAEANNIKPVIAQEFTFEQTVQAFEALQKQNAVGKIVVNIADQ
jgi:D-arabinose 1-dehydrogenase-like Zn-dependent alcohol dehydrogenase